MYLVLLRNSQMTWMCGIVSCNLETIMVRHLNFLKAQIDHSGCSTNRRPKSGVLQNAQQSRWKMEGAAAAKLFQSCPTLCDHIDGSPPGSPVPGILQARTLEWVAISFSNAWKWKVKVKSLSRVRLLATPWAAAYQAPPSMGFSRQEYWSGGPLPSPLL